MRHQRINEDYFSWLSFAMSGRSSHSDGVQQHAALGNHCVGINIVVEADLI